MQIDLVVHATHEAGVKFGGIGAVSNDFARWDSSETIATGGVGLRYLISRRHGMHAGIDLAFSEDSEAIYIQFGSAWMRP